MTVSAALANLPPNLPLREAHLLLALVLGQTREWVIAHPEQPLTSEQQSHFTELTTQAASGVPLPYLLGHWEFFGLDFVVTPDVLIPRPETELIVELALRSISNSPNSRILDIGTGSGIIAVTLAVKLPHTNISAVDISPAALAVAQANARHHNVADRITFIESDLLSTLAKHPEQSEWATAPLSTFDLILANLPYIPTDDLHSLTVAKHEPTLALDGGPDGLTLIRRLLADAPRCLAPGGTILLEIEYRQGEAVKEIAQAAFPNSPITVHKDLSGLDRVVEIVSAP